MATQLSHAALQARTQQVIDKAYDFIHGDDTSFVQTDNGPVACLANMAKNYPFADKILACTIKANEAGASATLAGQHNDAAQTAALALTQASADLVGIESALDAILA